jgi:hypothetical protein
MAMLAMLGLLTSCASGPPPTPSPAISPARSRDMIERSLPRAVPDRTGWAADMEAAFTVLGIEPSHENICAVVAVIEQESGFHVDPVIPGLPAVAWREINGRAERAGIPHLIVHGALQLTSSTGRSYGDRIDSARTEKDLSDIFEDFIGAVPMGRTPFALEDPCKSISHLPSNMRRPNPTPIP